MFVFGMIFLVDQIVVDVLDIITMHSHITYEQEGIRLPVFAFFQFSIPLYILICLTKVAKIPVFHPPLSLHLLGNSHS